MSIARRIFAPFVAIAAAVASAVGVRAKYDAAATNTNNRNHWSNADALDADSANAPGIRRTLRMRSRYEFANNSYANGVIKTHAVYVVGTGPRLQMRTPNPTVNADVQKAWRTWSKEIRLARKLRIAKMTEDRDGEVFFLFFTNPSLKNPVKLDFRLVEGEQITSALTGLTDPNNIDGVILDSYGNVVAYELAAHPGSTTLSGMSTQPRRIPASDMIHLFHEDRPGQHRGIPTITPSLPLFAKLRRYTQFTVDAAEVAALHSAVMQTTATADVPAADLDAGVTMPINNMQITALPEGWQLAQMKPEQPTTMYSDFKLEIVSEVARPMGMPLNIAAANSSKYNYASGRMDHQAYFRFIDVEQYDLEELVLDVIFEKWLEEAVLISGLLPQEARRLNADLDHEWFWDGYEHVDPNKEANAQETRLRNHTTTLAAEYAKEGKDWRQQMLQRKAELDFMRENEIPFERPEIIQTTTALTEDPEDA
jgi:lambda family phage portal protein